MVEERIIHFKTEISKESVRVFYGSPGWISIEITEKERGWFSHKINKTTLRLTLRDGMKLCSAINALNQTRLKNSGFEERS